MKRAFKRLAAATVVLVLSLASTGAAYAQRDVVEDSGPSGGNNGGVGIHVCTFADLAGCAPTALYTYQATGLTGAFADALFIYQEGVVTIGQALTEPVTLDNLPTTMPYIVASLGDPLNAFAHLAAVGGVNINWQVNGVTTFQINIYDRSFLLAGAPRPNSRVAYDIFQPNRHCSGGPPDYEEVPCPHDVLTTSPYVDGALDLDRTSQSYSNLASIDRSVTPEPAAWALMILGLGAAGAALRRRRSLAVAA